MSFTVTDLSTSAPVPTFTFLVNVDNSADPFDPDPMNHPSTHPMASYSPIVAAGDQTSAGDVPLPDGRYLVSVRAAGYKLWGRHFRIAGDVVTDGDGAPQGGGVIGVALQPQPLPLARMRVMVFPDFASTDGAPQFPETFENGVSGHSYDMSGFLVVIEDAVGQVIVDWYNNPICSQYDGAPGRSTPLGDPVPGTGGGCYTDRFGEVVIENLPVGRYEISVVPPEPNNGPDGKHWVQTTTIEGGLKIDAWLEEGSDGRGSPGELFVEPGVQTSHWFGFAPPMDWPAPGGATITGTLRNWVAWPPFEQLTYGEAVSRPWIAVNDLASDTMLYRTRGAADGTFSIPSVPAGTYQLTFWDDALDYIIWFRTVQVLPTDTVIDLDEVDAHGQAGVGIFRWFGWISGYVFVDDGRDAMGNFMPEWANNAVRDCMDPADMMTCERGIPHTDLPLRERDGSVRQLTSTNHHGFYELPEARSRMGRADVLEVGAGRFAWTGHSLHDEHYANLGQFGAPFADSVTVIPGDVGGDLLVTQLTWEGKRSMIDWGKRPWLPGENGGIAGAVIYATTRNEYDARLAAAEGYEPGIPNVTLNVYEAVAAAGYALCDPNDPPSCAAGVLLNTLQTDSYQHPRLSNPDNPAACDVLDQNGADLAADTTFLGRPAAQLIAENCIEVPMLGNETKDGAWDGGFAFADICPASVGFPCDESQLVPFAPGDYIVEVVPPPFHQIVKEEDNNTAEGDELYPLYLPPPCVGALHEVADITADYPAFPYGGEQRPLCDRKLVTIKDQQNAGVEFHLFTTDVPYDPALSGLGTTSWASTEAVPPPARLFGLVEDSIHINTDPTSLTYGEPRGVAHLPIGIYESGFGSATVGRRLLTVYTDELGFYEAILPSTQTTSCPTPSGVCPGMYVLVVNDPGDAAQPNPGFSKGYLTEPFTFEFFPGKYRQADTPTVPLNTFACGVPPDAPQIFQVSSPVFAGGGALTITGMRFGSNAEEPPLVTLDGTPLEVTSFLPAQPFGAAPIYEDIVTVSVPGDFPPGAHQLLVTSGPLTPRPPFFAGGGGKQSRNGLTIHVLGGAYDPPIVTVSPPATLDERPIQAAIDAAEPGSLIVVQPGAYHENLILHKGVKLQGYGPGGIVGVGELEAHDFPCTETPACPPTTPPGEEPFAHIQGSVIDGRFFTFDGGRRAAWLATLGGVVFDGPAEVPEGAAITVLVEDGELGAEGALVPLEEAPQIDGLGIETSRGEAGGALYVHAYGRHLVVSNNIFESNQSTHGGGISLGRPLAMGGMADATRNGQANNENDDIHIYRNRILENGGVLFAGGVGIFGGADGYRFENNDVCGNFSAEYGGGISHFGYSPGGVIRDNRVDFNDAFDEGGGIIIAGERDVSLGGIGSGDVLLERNVVQANMSNDDGGGLRLLRPLGDDPTTTPVENQITVINNMIVNNVAADFGGGVALDDAAEVIFANNTVAGNVSTSTAPDSVLGEAHSAGLVSECHSAGFAPADGSTFSDPVLFNNIFFDNLAYRYGTLPDAEEPGPRLVPTAYIDLEVFGVSCQLDGPAYLDPSYSFLSVAYAAGTENIVAEPLVEPPGEFVQEPSFVNRAPAHRLEIKVTPNRLNLNELMLSFGRPEGTLAGYTDYHLVPVPELSPAIDAGAADFTGVLAPPDDIDLEVRPAGLTWDMGADETTAPAAGVLSLVPAALTVNEANTTVTFTVQRLGGTAGLVTVDFTAMTTVGTPGSATPGADFASAAGTLTFAPGVTSQSFQIQILDDTAIEGAGEIFYVILDNPTGGAVLAAGEGDAVVGSVTIVDDDVPACANAGCSPDAECTPSATGFTCTCKHGYQGDGFVCGDVDECALGTDECGENATCVNEPGCYLCVCDTGFTGDGHECHDIDECEAGGAGCDENASCTNRPGSFVCECNDGYEGDGRECGAVHDEDDHDHPGDDDDEEDDDKGAGCSAAGSPSGSAWLLFLAAPWVALRRRRLLFAALAVLLSLFGGAAPAKAQAPVVCPPPGVDCERRFLMTDGWASLPGRGPLYIFGFVEADPSLRELPVTALDIYKGRVQTSAPIVAVDEGASFYLTLTNIGLVARPDLDDAHTLHWHGFRNATPLFDGVPEMSISVPPARDFTYFYRPRDPGTYMYHCHFEDVEHVQMGMTGIVYVHPRQNYGDPLFGIPAARLGGSSDPAAPRGYAYNDFEPPGDPFTTGSTAYDREFALLLNEFDTRPHDMLEAVQEFTWTDYRANYWLINGRSYPDTVLPMADPALPGQPNSSLIQVNEGERVLLRLADLGYEQHAVELLGVRLKVVGHDATLLRGSTGADMSYETNVLYLGPGESRDAIFVAPPHRGGPGPDVYLFRNRVLLRLHNDSQPGLGGMVTEVRVYPAGTLPPQSSPNQTF